IYKNANSVIEGNYDNTLLGANTYLLGLTSLFDEMGLQGHSISDVLSDTNISTDGINQSSLYISQVQKIQLFQNIQKLSHNPHIGLRAGQKQRLSDFGVYGYALYSSRNFRQAVELGIRHIKLAGPILKKSFYIRDDVAVFEGRTLLHLVSFCL
ncbi:AraC family transcriptional regulator ligand-binding domain-containing protein, partial [Pseudomonas aeruginosa]|uniref:AraC family transcriptional regulator ligand-binding domain-containing protein n=1 Tax=Pseudomonas aeruginosa TaxID=287 RepID=UPI0020D087E9